jgi:hypothetical protein
MNKTQDSFAPSFTAQKATAAKNPGVVKPKFDSAMPHLYREVVAGNGVT